MLPMQTAPHQRSRLSRIWRATLFLLVLALLVVHAVGAWMTSSWIRQDALEPVAVQSRADGAVMSLIDDEITLRSLVGADDDVAAPGVLGFATASDYLRLGDVVMVSETDVTRLYEIVEGGEPAVGESGLIDVNGSPVDAVARALDMIDTTYDGPLGVMGARFIEGTSTWFIHVHDRGHLADQALRMMQLLSVDGPSQLSIAYRNDPGQPPDQSGLVNYGVTERDDLAAAIGHARELGATTVFLVGYGSGAGVVMAELYRDPDIAGVILDGPALDIEDDVLRRAAESDGLVGMMPATAIRLGSVVASMRFGVSWDTANYLSRADQLSKPVLVIHGTADDRFSIEHSRALAAERPDLVELVEIPDAGPDRAWNLDPATYTDAVISFTDRVRASG